MNFVHPPGVWEVTGSMPVRDSDFSLSHVCDMLNISSFHISFTELKIYHLSIFIKHELVADNVSFFFLQHNLNMSAPIMSRFDLFFILVDDCNEVKRLLK